MLKAAISYLFRHLHLLGLVAALLFLVGRLYLQPGMPYTHDGENHLARFANYKVALKEGQYPPRFAPNLMNHYGYPVFNYNYPLANLVSLPFSFARVPYETTFQVLMVSAVGFGLVGMYLWLTTLGFSSSARAVAITVFASSNYLLSALIFRGNIGEVMAMMLLPWPLWFIERLRQKNIPWQTFLGKEFFWGTLIFALFLLSHNITAVFGMGLFIAYAVVSLRQQWRTWLQLALTIMTSIFLSLWFWLPALAEKSLVILDNAQLSKDFARHFPSLLELLWSPLQFGFSFVGGIDTLSFALGLSLFLAIALSAFSLTLPTARQHFSPQLFFLLISSFIFVGLQLSISEPIWQWLPIVRFVQFPWRLTLFLTVVATPFIGYVWQRLPSWRGVLFLLLVVQLVTFGRLKPVDNFHRTNLDYELFSQSTTTANENLPKRFTYLEIGDWQPRPTILKGEGQISVNSWTGTKRNYTVEITEPALVVEPTMLFAGWETRLLLPSGNSQLLTLVQNDQTQGRLAYELSTGSHTISSTFTQRTPARMIGNAVSLVTVLFLITYLVLRQKPRLLVFFVSWKIALLLSALFASGFLAYQPSFPYVKELLEPSGLPIWMYSWANFDGVHYLTIARQGYLSVGFIQAFFPLYPWLMQVARFISVPDIVAGLLISTISSAVLLWTWSRLLTLDYPKRTVWLGIISLFLFPTAFYLGALYNEALFLSLVIGSFLSARKQQWLLASILSIAATATRVVGIFLIPALLIELVLQNWPDTFSLNTWRRSPKRAFVTIGSILNKKRREVLLILFGSVGLAGYMLFLWYHFHDPLYFFHVQSEFGSGRQESIILYPQVVWRSLKILVTYPEHGLKYYAFAQEFAVGVLGFVGLLWGIKSVRLSYVFFSLCTFLLPTVTGTFSSIPRYILASFALFIVMAQLFTHHRKMGILWFAVSTFLLLFNTILFIQGYWIA